MESNCEDEDDNLGKVEEAVRQKKLPKDALVIAHILDEFNITEYEPRVINQFLEFTYRYVTTTLQNAQIYSKHANKKKIDLEDVTLASQFQQDLNFTRPLCRETLLEIHRVKNTQPLPFVEPLKGVRLPAEHLCGVRPVPLIRTVPLLNNKAAATATATVTSAQQSPSKPPLHTQATPGQPTSTITVPRTQSIFTPKPGIKFSPAGGSQPQKMVPAPKNSSLITTTGRKESLIATTGRKESLFQTTVRKQSLIAATRRKESLIPTTGRKESLIPTTVCKDSLLATTVRKENLIATTGRKESLIPTTVRKQSLIATTGRKESPIATTSHKDSLIATPGRNENRVATTGLKEVGKVKLDSDGPVQTGVKRKRNPPKFNP